MFNLMAFELSLLRHIELKTFSLKLFQHGNVLFIDGDHIHEYSLISFLRHASKQNDELQTNKNTSVT